MISPLNNFHLHAAAIAYIINLVRTASVGESLGISVRSGSVYPMTTRRALAFRKTSPLTFYSSSGKSFHVKTQRIFMIQSMGTPALNAGIIASSARKESNSLSLASANYYRSSDVHFHKFTSTDHFSLRVRYGPVLVYSSFPFGVSRVAIA